MLTYYNRAILLFLIGVLFNLVFRIHQIQNHIPVLTSSLFHNGVDQPTWWIPTVCGIAAAFVGLLYPCVDKKLGKVETLHQEWTSVLRCTAIFVGINHASAKLQFSSHEDLMVTLAAMSVALWWLCDRTRRGLGLGLSTALLAALVIQVVIKNGLYKCAEQEYSYVQAWSSCLFFTGGITVGNIGRRLAQDDENSLDSASHQHVN